MITSYCELRVITANYYLKIFVTLSSNLNSVLFPTAYIYMFGNVFQFVSWLTFLHVSYYSLAFRINQLTLYFQKREELIESNVDYDKDNEDDAIVPKLDILNKR